MTAATAIPRVAAVARTGRRIRRRRVTLYTFLTVMALTWVALGIWGITFPVVMALLVVDFRRRIAAQP